MVGVARTYVTIGQWRNKTTEGGPTERETEEKVEEGGQR